MPAASFELVVFDRSSPHWLGLPLCLPRCVFFGCGPRHPLSPNKPPDECSDRKPILCVAAVEDQARGLRQELGRTLASFQDVTLKAFGTLRDGIDVQIRTFGERLDAGVKATGESVTTISTKLTHDMEQMRGEANTHLRSSADIPLFRSMWIFHNGLSGAKNSWPCTSDTRRLSRGHLPGRRCTRKKRSMPFVVLPWSPE